ncbi:unnamed protein product, partial [Musa acuminata subsp. burmannicoides]
GSREEGKRSSTAMAPSMTQIRRTYRRFKPHLLMTMAQLGYTILYFITEASFDQGLNPHVFVTYRHIVAALVMWPFAYFLERKLRPKLTWALFLEICVISLLGVSLTLNMYFASLKYTSPTFVASMINTIAAVTFVTAILLSLLGHRTCHSWQFIAECKLTAPMAISWFRMERLDLGSPKGVAKVAGTVVSLAGVTTMTLYKGPAMKNFYGPLIQIHGNSIHENWLKGSLLTVASCITWSVWYIMQATTLRRYPAQLSLTAWMCFVGGAQSAIFAAFVEHKPAAWKLGFDVKLWSILYAGIVGSGLIIYIKLWCTKEKGPVFVTMFNPLGTIMVAVLAYFAFGEKLFLGSIIGGIVVAIGLYLVLWGKERDQEDMTPEGASFVASETGKEETSTLSRA